MSTLVYLGVVGAGALTLLIEARQKFNLSLNATPFSEYPILKTTEISDLCTPRERNVSFAFYALLYLATYALVLSSAELYSLLTKTSASGLKIGPVDTIAGQYDDPTRLLDTQYGKPIFVSAAIIAAFNIGIFQSIERNMRTLAHRLAGVPRGVYFVIQQLNGVTASAELTGDAAGANPDCEGPYVCRFRAHAEAAYRNSCDKADIAHILLDLRAVEDLAPSLIGETRVSYFPASQLDAMSKLSANLERELNDLRSLLDKQPASPEDRKIIREAVSTAARDTIALFAVNYLRNDRAVTDIPATGPLRRIDQEIRPRYAVEANSFSIAILLTFVLSAMVTFWQWQDWSEARIGGYPKDLRAEVWQAFDRAQGQDGQPDSVARIATLCAEAEKAKEAAKPMVVVVAEEFPGEAIEACENAWNAALAARRNQDWHRNVMNAPLVSLPVVVAVALAAISAIAGRSLQLENQAWPTGWPLRQPPFQRLILMSIVPALLAVLGVTAAEFVIQWVGSGFQLQQNDIVRFFQSKGLFFALHAAIGFVISIAVLVLSDLHDDQKVSGASVAPKPAAGSPQQDAETRKGLTWYASILLGVCWAVVAMVLYYGLVIISYGPASIGFRQEGAQFSLLLRETIVQGSVAAIFLVLYAVFLEFTEAGHRHGPRAAKPSEKVG